jgi:hypothetical protein
MMVRTLLVVSAVLTGCASAWAQEKIKVGIGPADSASASAPSWNQASSSNAKVCSRNISASATSTRRPKRS